MLAAQMRLGGALLDRIRFRTHYHRACCRGGFRLENAKKLTAEHGSEPLERKLALLGQLQWMGRPHLLPDGRISSGGGAGTPTADGYVCSCWRFGGHKPENGPMPASYCLLRGGIFAFTMKRALGIKLRPSRYLERLLRPLRPCSLSKR
jgi:hypothetical protein